MIHGVAQDRTTLTEPLDLCPGLGGLAASVQIERNARLIFLTDSNDILFQVSRIAQGQGILGGCKGVLHFLGALRCGQSNASPIALGFRGTIVGMLSQLLSGDRYVVNAACALGNDFSIIASCRVQLFVLVGVGLCIVVQLGGTNRRSRVRIHGQRHAGQVHMIHGVAQDCALLTEPLDLCPGLGSLAASIHIEGDAGLIFDHILFQPRRFAQGQRILGLGKGVLHLRCTFGSSQRKADPVALGAIRVVVLFQVLDGNCNLGVVDTRLRFRYLVCADVVAVLVIQSLDRLIRLVRQLCGVDRFRRSRSRGRARVSCVALSRESSRGQQGQQQA